MSTWRGSLQMASTLRAVASQIELIAEGEEKVFTEVDIRNQLGSWMGDEWEELVAVLTCHALDIGPMFPGDEYDESRDKRLLTEYYESKGQTYESF